VEDRAVPKTGAYIQAFLLTVALSVASIALPSDRDRAAGKQSWPTHGWLHATAASVGLDPTVLAALDQDIAKGKYSLVDSFQVFRCGAMVYDRRYDHDYAKLYWKEAHTKSPLNARLTGPYNYFDPLWHPYYHGTDLHTMQSVSKSVTSAIFGVAITRGDFKAGLDTPIYRYFDFAKVRNVDERKRRITLRHVLTMSTGLEWHEMDVAYDDPRSDSSRMEATDDWVRYVIDRPMAANPGTRFNYSSGDAELLAYIFEKETHQDIDAYGEQHLFAPLGMRHHWKRTYLGVVDTEGGLYLAGQDLAKIGYLYLNDGLWEGSRLISADWIRQSLTPAFDTGWQGLKYGYKWWLQPRNGGGDWIWHAIGLGGQRLMVFPSEQLIATFTGWDVLQDPALDSELADRLLPAVRSASCPKRAD
jgi:CubicO group peptidase (beta-lactamase class C family)